MKDKTVLKSVIIGLSLLLGFSSLGSFIFKGLKTFSDKDRVVTVKGLAEMKMTASAAAIVIDFSLSGDDLPQVIKQAENKKSQIIAYLATVGYPKNEIKIANIDITDQEKYYEQRWEDGKQVAVKIDRYIITQKLTIKTKEVANTENKIAEIKLDLISKDLTSNIEPIAS